MHGQVERTEPVAQPGRCSCSSFFSCSQRTSKSRVSKHASWANAAAARLHTYCNHPTSNHNEAIGMQAHATQAHGMAGERHLMTRSFTALSSKQLLCSAAQHGTACRNMLNALLHVFLAQLKSGCLPGLSLPTRTPAKVPVQNTCSLLLRDQQHHGHKLPTHCIKELPTCSQQHAAAAAPATAPAATVAARHHRVAMQYTMHQGCNAVHTSAFCFDRQH
jgi:hypothetical protein